MTKLATYFFSPSSLIGADVKHRTLGWGVITDIEYGEEGSDYVFVKFNEDSSKFSADIFLNKWGRYFTDSVDDLLRADKKLRGIANRLKDDQEELNGIATSLLAIQIEPSQNYTCKLEPSDYRLCLAWAGRASDIGSRLGHGELEKELSKYEAARLMSARQAELVVIAAFRSKGHTVEDISATQLLTPNNGRWKDFDLLIDGRPVDIKNARKSYSNPKTYVEHCVPRFKEDRLTSADVSILGVLSEYLQPENIASGFGTCVILGEVNVSDIRKLHAWLKTRFGKLFDFNGLWNPGYQPGWVFEYPSAQYKQRTSCWPSIELAIANRLRVGSGVKSVPGWLLALRENAADTATLGLPSEMQQILDDLYDLKLKIGFTRPALYMYVMAYFLQAITQGKRVDQVVPLLRNILLVPSKKYGKDTYSPLGLVDPMNYVTDLFDVFETVFDHIQTQGIQFNGFRLLDPGILKGLVINEAWITVLAYCGGWHSSPRVKCGASPLFLGRHKTCPSCHHLICDACGFCSKQCR